MRLPACLCEGAGALTPLHPVPPAGKEPPQPAVPAAPAPLCHGGRAALGPAGDLPAGWCAQGAGEGASPGERGFGAGGERGAGGLGGARRLVAPAVLWGSGCQRGSLLGGLTGVWAG